MPTCLLRCCSAKAIPPFEVGLNLAYTRNVGRIAVSPLGPYTNYIDAPKTDFTIGLPLGIRYQSAKGGLFLKIFATPYLYLNHRQYFAVNAVSELRTLNYENSFFSQVQGQVAIGYSFKK
jgi:hypothetical protein